MRLPSRLDDVLLMARALLCAPKQPAVKRTCTLLEKVAAAAVSATGPSAVATRQSPMNVSFQRLAQTIGVCAGGVVRVQA